MEIGRHAKAGETLVDVENLKMYFPVTAGLIFQRKVADVKAVDGVSMNIKRGETLGLVGESGCGKSTLARIVMALDRPTAGEVLLEGDSLFQLSAGALRQRRRDFQMVFQDPYGSLNPRMNVRDLLGEGLRIRGGVARTEITAEVRRHLTLVGLDDTALTKYPHQFSGGQRQRLCIARAVIVRPKILIADEAASALDVSVQMQILNLLLDLRQRIGLGIMGAPMAGHLIKGGHRVYLHSHGGIPPALTDAGGIACANGRDVAEKADVVITMVPDTPHVQDVLFGDNGVAQGLSKGKIVVDMSSISPIATRDFAARINALGSEYLDAPVSGGEVGAKAASLTIMVGGSEAAFNRVKPLFELMGKNITLVGDIGAGQTTKVANQIIVALTIEAVGEALLFASKAGADPAKVREALMGGFASSRILEVHGERMIKRTFDPGFRIELHQKDLSLALAGARALNLSLPNTATTQELFNAAAALGGKGWDHSGLVRVLEHLAQHPVAKG